MILKILEEKLTTQSAYKTKRHLIDAANGVYMSCIRNKIDLSSLLNDIENGTAFKVSEFFTATSGNLIDYLKSDYHVIAQSLIDIVAGGNGGMASVGRGEFFVAFLSNFSATISKSGNGDIDYNGKCEEMKYNGGKINVAAKPGREVFKTFMMLLEDSNVNLKKSDYLPNRKDNTKLYDATEIATLNGLYWNATVDEDVGQLTYNEWAIKCVERAAEETFKKSNTLLIIDDNNNFVRFTNPKEIVEYYKDRVEFLNFELRNKQSNPVAIYMKAA
jgi:hypothetical protein|tara:strand:+ start:73 stop:894 length:822 start_codon:yes stop_codon:yes gene_type:complete